MTAAPIDYATPPAPTRWQRWRAWITRGMIGGSHVIAAAVTMAVLIITGVCLGLNAMLYAFSGPSTGDDEMGPLVIILGFILLMVVGAAAGTIAGGLAILAGIGIDAARRPLRLPWWAVLLIVPAVAELMGILGWLVFDGFSIASLKSGSLLGLGIAGVFCVYWITLGCAEGIMKFVRWGIERLVAWWKSRRHRKKR